jgi:hypothetical protein
MIIIIGTAVETSNLTINNLIELLQLWVTGLTAEVPFPAGARGISLLHSVQTVSGSHPTGIGGSFSRGKAAGA